MDESYIKFDSAMLKQVVHFVCANVEPSKLGTVRLHKILYLADMLHYLGTGKALTGVDYTKQKFGPAARNLSTVIAELEQEGKLRVDDRLYHGLSKNHYTSLRTPETSLTNAQIGLLLDALAFVIEGASNDISDLDHNAAWRVAYFGERIPYASVYGFIPIEVTPEDIEAAWQEAEKLRPHILASDHANG